MLKIAFVINSMKSRNGACVFLMSLIEQMIANHDADIVLVTLYDEIDESFQAIIKNKGIRHYSCGKKKRIDFQASKRLRDIILLFQPDFINIHLSVMPSYYFAFGTKKRKWSIVKTFHSVPGHDLNKFSLFFENLYIKKKMIHFIGISDEISKGIRQKYPYANVATIYNGINIDSSINYQNTQSKEYDLVIVASLEPVKNHYLLFNAVHSITNKIKTIKLLVVGGGSKYDEYLSYIQQNGLEKNITLIGTQHNVFKHLLKSKVFVLTSNREGNPISILEAMSCGLPIVASNVGGIPDIIENGINGFLFEAGNLDDLSSKILFLLSNRDEYETISHNNLEKSKQYDIKNVSKKYLSFFNSIFISNSNEREKHKKYDKAN